MSGYEGYMMCHKCSFKSPEHWSWCVARGDIWCAACRWKCENIEPKTCRAIKTETIIIPRGWNGMLIKEEKDSEYDDLPIG